jgi:hypothetical protein
MEVVDRNWNYNEIDDYAEIWGKLREFGNVEEREIRV